MTVTPYSYREYTGNGANRDFQVPFPYLLKAHVKVYTGLNLATGAYTSLLVDGTDYSWTSTTNVQLTTAPAAGVKVTVKRETPTSDLLTQWQDGSTLIAEDLLTSDKQNLYAVQEEQDLLDVGVALSVSATTAANAATTAANAATTTANTSLTQSGTALTQSSTALTQSGQAVTASSNAVTTANASSASAASAVSTANAASAAASSAVSTANTANSKADQAINAVATAILYDLVANVAAIPASPASNDAVEVADSTGIQSFTPLAGKPAGFVGDPGLSVRIVYTSAGSTWNWIQYFPNDPENRYGAAITTLEGDVLGLDSSKLDASTAASTYQPISGMSSYLTTTAAGTTYAPLASPTFTGTVTIPAGASISGYLTTATASSTYQTQAGMSGYLATSSIGTTVQSYDADTVKSDVIPTFTVATRTTERTITAGAFDLSTGNLWTCGAITVPNPTNAVAGQTGAIRITAGPVVWSSNFKFPGGTAPTIATFPAVIPYYVSGSSTILMGNAVAGIA